MGKLTIGDQSLEIGGQNQKSKVGSRIIKLVNFSSQNQNSRRILPNYFIILEIKRIFHYEFHNSSSADVANFIIAEAPAL